MTIFFNGNDCENYKYELEGIIKLFFPVLHFHFAVDEKNDFSDEYIQFNIEYIDEKNVSLFVEVFINNQKKTQEIKILFDSAEIERNLCIMAFCLLKEITGIFPKWGILTGVRPVKIVQDMRKSGKSFEEIHNFLQEKYLVSDEKLSLAFLTANTQAKFLCENDDKSYSLYISIPFCKTRCSYCSFVSSAINTKKSLEKVSQYITLLCEEIAETAIVAKKLNFNLESIYIGGGTPTAISCEQLSQVMTAIKNNFDLNLIKEYTVEAGRADTITLEKLNVIKNLGAKRISINPQTFNDDVLKKIGRNHTAQAVIDCYYMAKELGFDSINMDFIAGLPDDNLQSFMASIDKAILLSPENITVHTLSIKRSADLFTEESDENQDEVAQMVEYARKAMARNNYFPYYLYRQKNTVGNLENVGYSKPDHESLYNIKIMDETQTILACGAGGATKLCNVKNGLCIRRIFNYKYHHEYIDRFDEILKRKQEVLNIYENSN